MLSTDEIIDGKYRIVRLVGEGGMGAVYEGQNARIRRRVAVKVLHGDVARQPEAAMRFEREAQAAGRIGSPHIVEVLDLGTLPTGQPYMVMEFLEGESLSQRIQTRKRLTPLEVVSIAEQILEGLGAAHGAGIVHRDLKPDNVLVLEKHAGRSDYVKLVDFGVSKFSPVQGESEFNLTRTGAVMGTPYYMAPEQARGAKDLDHRVDLYAAGVILYECLTGELPFVAETFNELMFKIALEQPKSLLALMPELDPSLVAIVEKAMARDPADRFQTAASLQQALVAWRSGVSLSLTERLPPSAALTSAVGSRPAGVGPAPLSAAAAVPSVQPPTVPDTRTPGSWTQAELADPTFKRRRRQRTVLAVLGVAVLGLAVVGARSVWTSGPPPEAAASSAESQEQAAREAAARQAELARIEQARREAEAARAEAERARLEAERARKLAEERSQAEPKARAPKPRPAPARPRSAPAQPEAPKPKAPAPEAPRTPGGRPIRTTL